MQTVFLRIPLHHLFQAGLINRQDAVDEIIDLFLVDIYAGNIYAYLGKTSTSNKTNISGPYNYDLHIILFKLRALLYKLQYGFCNIIYCFFIQFRVHWQREHGFTKFFCNRKVASFMAVACKSFLKMK